MGAEDHRRRQHARVKAIKLYQKLLAFHKDDADKSALLDADLHRLRFGWNKAVGETKNDALQGRARSVRRRPTRARTLRDGPLPARGRRAGRRRPREGPRDRARRREGASPKAPAGSCASTSSRTSRASPPASPPSACGPTRCPTIKRHVQEHHEGVLPRRAGRLRRAAEGGAAGGRSNSTGTRRRRCSRKKPVLEFDHDLPATPTTSSEPRSSPRPKGLKPGLLLPHRQPRRGLRRGEQLGQLHRRLGVRPRHRQPARATASPKWPGW